MALAAVIMGVATPTASAAGSPAIPGHDVSHPQCGAALPKTSAFGIVGVNQGRPFSNNPCLADQYQWAVGRPTSPAMYVNTSNPAPSSDFYWPSSGSSDPALCIDSRSTTDPGCAYDYGWHAAASALKTGKKLGTAVLTHAWWLDVETTNTWNGDSTSNTAVLQGMYDYLRSHGVDNVGLYSSGYQWKNITGGYTASNAARYASAWGPHVTPDFPLHSAPLWIATAASSSTARTSCSTSFTEAPAQMVQFIGTDGLDTNLNC